MGLTLNDFGISTWDQLIPICILVIIMLIFLIACFKECKFERYRNEPQQFPKKDLGPLPKITVTNGRTGEERVIQE